MILYFEQFWFIVKWLKFQKCVVISSYYILSSQTFYVSNDLLFVFENIFPILIWWRYKDTKVLDRTSYKIINKSFLVVINYSIIITICLALYEINESWQIIMKRYFTIFLCLAVMILKFVYIPVFFNIISLIKPLCFCTFLGCFLVFTNKIRW